MCVIKSVSEQFQRKIASQDSLWKRAVYFDQFQPRYVLVIAHNGYRIDIAGYRCTVVVFAFWVVILCTSTTYTCLHSILPRETCHLLINYSVCTLEQVRSISHIDNLVLLLSSLLYSQVCDLNISQELQ